MIRTTRAILILSTVLMAAIAHAEKKGGFQILPRGSDMQVLAGLADEATAPPTPAGAAGRETGHVTVRAHAPDGRPIEGAFVNAGRLRAETDAEGAAKLALPAGPARIAVTRLGFLPDTLRLDVRAGMD